MSPPTNNAAPTGTSDAPAGEAQGGDRFKLVGTLLEGKFQVEAFVAEGGFGVVYRAVQKSLDRQVAVKVLKNPPKITEEGRREFMDRFALEAKTMARLTHPNIVQVVDHGVAAMPSGEQAAFMVLEWCAGKTLEDDLKARRRQGGRAPTETLALLRDVIEAVAFAHERGVAHRDLKPENMVSVEGRRGPTFRLLDFGIAKTMNEGETAGSGQTRTASGTIACSPRYAAPEQLSGARTGPWTDVHALGMILTEVLTDRQAYAGRDITGIYAEALSPVRPTPKKLRVDVGAWEPVLEKATAIRPDDRYADAGALLTALEAALAGAPRDVSRAETAVMGSQAGDRASGAPVELGATAALPGAGMSTSAIEAPPAQLHSTTLRGAAVSREVPLPPAAPATSPRWRTAAIASLGALAALAALVGVGMALPDDPAAAARTPPAAAQLAAPTPSAAPAPAPTVAAPTVAAPTVAAPTVAAPTAAAPTAERAEAEEPARATRRSRRRRARDSASPSTGSSFRVE